MSEFRRMRTRVKKSDISPGLKSLRLRLIDKAEQGLILLPDALVVELEEDEPVEIVHSVPNYFLYLVAFNIVVALLCLGVALWL